MIRPSSHFAHDLAMLSKLEGRSPEVSKQLPLATSSTITLELPNSTPLDNVTRPGTHDQKPTTESNTLPTQVQEVFSGAMSNYRGVARQFRAFISQSSPGIDATSVLSTNNKPIRDHWINLFQKSRKFELKIIDAAARLICMQPPTTYQRYEASTGDKPLIALLNPEACAISDIATQGYKCSLRKASYKLSLNLAPPRSLQELITLDPAAYSKTLQILSLRDPNMRQAINKLKAVVANRQILEETELTKGASELAGLKFAQLRITGCPDDEPPRPPGEPPGPTSGHREPALSAKFT